MTRYQRFIRDSLAKVEAVAIDEELKGIDARVLKLNIADFFNSNSPLFIHDILNYRLTDPSFKYENDFPDNAFSSSYTADTEEAARFLSKSKSLFWRALGLEDVRLLLTALIIFRRFGCDYSILFDLSELKHDKQIWLTNCLVQFSNVTMKIGFRDYTPDYEKTLFEDYCRGYRQFSISATYQFVDTLERSSAFYSHYLADEAIKLLHYVDTDKFVMQLEQLNEPLKIIPFLRALSYNEKLKLLQVPHNFSEWVFFEIFRQVSKEQALDIAKEDIHTVSIGALSLYTQNAKFFLKTAHYFQSDPLFNSVLGVALARVRLKDFRAFVKAIELDEFKNQKKCQALCGLLNHLEKHDSENRVLYLCRMVYQKWHTLLDKSLTGGSYFSEPIVTDYFCCILKYFEFRYDTPLKASRAISKIIDTLEEYDSVWFKTVNEKSSHYFALLSILYVHSFLWKSKGLTATSATKRKLMAVLSDRRVHLLNYRKAEQPAFYREMIENFGIVVE